MFTGLSSRRIFSKIHSCLVCVCVLCFMALGSKNPRITQDFGAQWPGAYHQQGQGQAAVDQGWSCLWCDLREEGQGLHGGRPGNFGHRRLWRRLHGWLLGGCVTLPSLRISWGGCTAVCVFGICGDGKKMKERIISHKAHGIWPKYCWHMCQLCGIWRCGGEKGYCLTNRIAKNNGKQTASMGAHVWTFPPVPSWFVMLKLNCKICIFIFLQTIIDH